jgi:nitroimidazol reductase NimA-like FMN-containing flavoprotein (pyridoxamine 5'-phosphate oxidase superfamily)
MKSIQSNSQLEAEKVIADAKICFVGLADTDGTPYVLPMNFGYSNGVIYLHSAPEGTHLAVLERNNRVCITFCIGDELVYQNEEVACSYRMRSDSTVCRGRVEFIEDLTEKTDVMHIMMSKYTDREFAYSMPSIKNVKVWKIEIESFSSKSFGLTHQEFLAKKEDQNQAHK